MKTPVKDHIRISHAVTPACKKWVEIDRAVLKRNIGSIKQRIGTSTEILAVVKADAYGHGMEPTVRTALSEGIRWYGVADVHEGIALRKSFKDIRVLVLGNCESEDMEAIVQWNLTPVVCSFKTAERLNTLARERMKVVNIHIKVDTGMGRIGVWHEDCHAFVEKIFHLRNLAIEGICSHFPAADEDKDFSLAQQELFKRLILNLETHGISIPLRHIANSSALCNLPHDSFFTMVRPGIMLYGVMPGSDFSCQPTVSPILSLKTRISFIKHVLRGRTISYGRTFTAPHDTVIATLPIGYADGYMRRLSNVAAVIVHGRRVPVVGVVTMDQIMVDLGNISGVTMEEEAVLIGTQGNECITVEEVAAWADTIPYEILCGIGKRVHRVYLP